MNRTGYLLLMLSCGLLISACQHKSVRPDSDLQQLAVWLTGMFDSSEQSENDQDFFDIRLVATEIWQEREDGIWIYLEQASSDNTRNPYRQRIYHLHEQQQGLYVSDVYTLPDPDTAVGSWKRPAMLDEFGPEDLSLRTGCSVYLQRENGQVFSGGTRGNGCHSNLNNASYATSEVLVNADGIDSWDRGFNSDGEQVWGARSGPYLFRRVEQ